MGEQTTIAEFSQGVLPDGTILKEGDIVMYQVGPYEKFTKIIIDNGKLCLRKCFMYGDSMPIDRFLSNGSYYHVTKYSLKEVYQYLKKYNQKTSDYLIELSN